MVRVTFKRGLDLESLKTDFVAISESVAQATVSSMKQAGASSLAEISLSRAQQARRSQGVELACRKAGQRLLRLAE